MSNQPEINPKKLILSTTEVSKLLLSKGRRKINESLTSHGVKTLNNIDLTDLTSQINLKLSKENENANNTVMGEQSVFKPFGEKSIMYNKQRNLLDKSGFLNGAEKLNQKDNMNNNNYFSKLDKSQFGMGLEGLEQINQEYRNKKKLIRLDSTEIGLDKNKSIKINNIVNNYYFPYENENNLNLENSTKLKNFVVIFYFIIEQTTFLLIRKLDKKLVPLYFWNREEDAKRFGINYSQVNTPGLYFRTFENFKEAFKYKGQNFMETINKLTNILKEKRIEYEKNIEEIKNEYELKIKELSEKNELLSEKIEEYENDNNLKNQKIKELTTNINQINEEMKDLKLINEKLLLENKKLKMELNNIINKNKENINLSNKKDEQKKNQNDNTVVKSFFKSRTKLDLNPNKLFKLANQKNKNSSGKNLIKHSYQNHISENISEKEMNISESEEDKDNSFPKLEEYNIDNDEEEKIDNIRTVSNIKTYGQRKKLHENYNSANNTIKNNIFMSIKENSSNKERNNLDRNLSEELDYNNNMIPESKSSFSNQYMEESSND